MLQLEAQWISTLVWFQLLTTGAFGFWRLGLKSIEQIFDEMKLRDYSSAKGPTTSPQLHQGGTVRSLANPEGYISVEEDDDEEEYVRLRSLL